jgi:hypothetical protein
MKLSLAAAGATVASLAASSAAAAATLQTRPAKPCFGSGDTVNFVGSGFTPGDLVDFTKAGQPVRGSPIQAQADGTVSARLTVIQANGSERRTYAATERQNPTNTASTRITVNELDARLRPLEDAAGRWRIVAQGFTTGRSLWAHVLFRGSVRNLRIGRLRGPCRRLRREKRLFAPDAPSGRRLIHFDTSRRFRRARPAQRISFDIVPRETPGSADPTRRYARARSATTGAVEKSSSPSAASTRTRSPAPNSPSSIFSASGSTRRFWITRFSGRAP